MIQVTKISKSFGKGAAKIVALKEISLKIKKGEFIALVGPSGSGKSTLLHILGGLDTATKGSVKIESKEIAKLSDSELSKYRSQKIGFIFQEFFLEPFLNVTENVLLPTKFHNKQTDKKYAKELLTEVGLLSKASANVKTLSGGQRQRTAIARALINHPQIILADEPTGNLDTETGKKIITLLKKLHKKYGVTLIVATHDEKIAKAASRIITLK